MRRGYPRNRKRHREIAKLRATGMSFQAIADRLGASPQAVHETLQRSGYAMAIPIPCRKCKIVITEMRMAANNNGPVYCMNCLPRTANIRPTAQGVQACWQPHTERFE